MHAKKIGGKEASGGETELTSHQRATSERQRARETAPKAEHAAGRVIKRPTRLASPANGDAACGIRAGSAVPATPPPFYPTPHFGFFIAFYFRAGPPVS